MRFWVLKGESRQCSKSHSIVVSATRHGADLASFDQVFIVYVVGGLMVAFSVILELFTCLGAMGKKTLRLRIFLLLGNI